MEGSEKVVTGDMGLLGSSPFSLLRSMYIVWDTVGVVMERRNGRTGAGGHEMVADDRSHRPAIQRSCTTGSGGNKRRDPEQVQDGRKEKNTGEEVRPRQAD